MHFLTLFFLFFSTLAFGASISESPHAPWGFDESLAQPLTEKKTSSYSAPSLACQKMIRFFQVYISPIDGPRSHYFPTSSQYTMQAIQKHGVLKGLALGCDRLMRENGEEWVYSRSKGQDERKLDPVR